MIVDGYCLAKERRNRRCVRKQSESTWSWRWQRQPAGEQLSLVNQDDSAQGWKKRWYSEKEEKKSKRGSGQGRMEIESIHLAVPTVPGFRCGQSWLRGATAVYKLYSTADYNRTLYFAFIFLSST